jgi:hypothetical protein
MTATPDDQLEPVDPEAGDDVVEGAEAEQEAYELEAEAVPDAAPEEDLAAGPPDGR